MLVLHKTLNNHVTLKMPETRSETFFVKYQLRICVCLPVAKFNISVCRKSSKYWDSCAWANGEGRDQIAPRLPFNLPFLDALLHCKIKVYHFRTVTVILLGVPFLRSFTVFTCVYHDTSNMYTVAPAYSKLHPELEKNYHRHSKFWKQPSDGSV